MSLYFDSQLCAFFNSELGPVPDGALPVEEETYQAIQAGLQAGQRLAANKKGQPVLLDALPPTPEELAAQAQAELTRRIQMATFAIAPLADALELGIATEEEQASLIAWKRYRIELSRMPQQPGYPTDIDWPTEPLK
ncbi:tail fiber assembly protein [Neisseriaceae bacterium TC5R-5]|nr:tail fiber assembly protein [Neisseriaceae bacterium TC5R-5]